MLDSKNNTSKLKTNTASSLKKVGHWLGGLQLGLTERNGKTVLAEKQQSGPYTVQRSFYPEGGICHLILLHPPGGLVEGDCLELSTSLDKQSHCVMTTPSAGKVYRCESVEAGQKQEFHLSDHSVLEWFPQETILFANSKSNLHTSISLEKEARFIGWELICLGRPIAKDNFEGGYLSQHIEIKVDNQPVLNERLVIDSVESKDPALSSDWGFADYTVFGSLYITGASKAHLDIARKVIDEFGASKKHFRIAASLVDGLLICRGLTSQSRHLKTAFMQIWSALRHELLGVEMNTPRIWNT